MTPSETATIGFRGISKRFPGVVALRGVTFDVAAGSCHALMGENGAGKSTLGKVLAGLHRADEGHIEIAGRRCAIHSPADAQREGISIVHQELSYCPNLTVAENLCLPQMPRRGLMVDLAAMIRRAQEFLNAVGAECDPADELGTLTTGQIQLVQIAAALATGANILVMDEPTSSLSLSEARKLEALIMDLQHRGKTILYVSHRMDEIYRLCDTATVLRDGQLVGTVPLAGTSEDELVRMMIGRPLSAYFPGHVSRARGDEVLRVESLSSPGKFRDVAFSLHAGEVLGVAGLVGAGRSEVAQGIFGSDPAVAGNIYLDGKNVKIRSPREALSLGLGLLTEDRKRLGMVPGMSCGANATLASLHCHWNYGFLRQLASCPTCTKREECLKFWGVVQTRHEDRWILEIFARLRVRATSPGVPMVTLSGGNQQKVMLAKLLARRCRVLIIDEPTRGVDVGAKAEIHRLIDELAAAGQAVLMISSDLPEILHLSTRVMVMRQGRVAGFVSRSEASEETLMQLMAGRTMTGTETKRNGSVSAMAESGKN